MAVHINIKHIAVEYKFFHRCDRIGTYRKFVPRFGVLLNLAENYFHQETFYAIGQGNARSITVALGVVEFVGVEIAVQYLRHKRINNRVSVLVARPVHLSHDHVRTFFQKSTAALPVTLFGIVHMFGKKCQKRFGTYYHIRKKFVRFRMYSLVEVFFYVRSDL